jgi:hypothetical protein
MSAFVGLLNLACGQELVAGRDGRASRLQAVISALIAALVLAGLWGAAAGSRLLSLSLANLYKLPMIVLLTALSAIPAGLVTWKLIAAQYRATDLTLSYALGVFAGTLVMAVLAPLVALYYHSSSWAGPALGMGSVFLAITVGAAIFVRNLVLRVPAEVARWTVVLPAVVLLAMQLASLVQLVAIASPILPEITVFDGGIDRIMAP